MARTLPGFIEFRRDRVSASWFLVCRACGVKEHYDKYWPASQAVWDHVDWHQQDEDEKRVGS